MDEQVDGRAWARRVADEVRVLVVAGVPFGAAMGLASRLAMLVLRVTSPDHVVGLESDDGFEIGRFTLAGTYNLVLLGAAVGVIGAGLYRLVAGRLLGPPWFRYLTVGLACGAVVGSILLHSDGIDFRVLHPLGLAVALFIAIPFVFGLLIGPIVEAVCRARPPAGWRRWVLPAVLVACTPATLPVLIVVGVVAAILLALRELVVVRRIRSTTTYAVVVSAGWLIVALTGLVALRRDIGEIL